MIGMAVLAGGLALLWTGGWIALKIRDRRKRRAARYLAEMENHMVDANLAFDPKKINKRREQAIKDQIQ